jgi:hypothetical protein
MSNQIKFKRSNVPGRVPTVDDIQPGEIALNTYDGKLFTNQTQGALSRIVEIGGGASQSVLYVSKSGNDDNDGKTLATAKLTIKSALSIATPGTTVFVKSGEYIEQNPLLVPARVAIVGDSLRTVTIRPANTDQDICWVNNGSYIFQLNFKGHVAPAAAVAFPPDGSAGYIVTSPYVQAVTSITTTGTGMRVDGAVTEGLKSMVVDAFTQYNQGGIGIHMLNRGNTQLVSVFTICCEISFLCENGGFCSITNSNTSFGTFGLISRGTSEPLYYGTTGENVASRQFLVKNLAQRPNVGDGVLFANYNQETCERDAGLIVDSLAFDLLYGGSTQSTFAGLRYWDRGNTNIQGETLQTAAALEYASGVTQAFLRGLPVTPQAGNVVSVPSLSVTGTEHGARLVSDDYAKIVSIIRSGPQADFIVKNPDFDAAESEYKALRNQVLTERARIIQGVTDYIATNYPTLEYDKPTCERDMGLIIDAVVDDLVFGSNYKSNIAALSYVNAAGGLYIPAEQLPATLGSIEYVRTQVSEIVSEDPYAVGFVNNRFTDITNIMNGTPAPAPVYPSPNEFLEGLAVNLQTNKPFVVAETLAFMAQNYPAFDFNESICARDIAYTIDALCYDLVYGGNSQGIRAGQRYYSYLTGASFLPEDEVSYTISAFEYVQLTLERVAINDPITPLQGVVTQDLTGVAATTLETGFIATTYGNITNLIRTGVAGTSGTIIPNGEASTDQPVLDNYTILQETKDYVVADTIAWIANTYPGFTYDTATCIRDLERIVDSVSFDLLHGGNRQSVQAGLYYFTNTNETIIESQEIQTSGILDYVRELMQYIVTATPAPRSWQQTYQQVLDLPPADTSVLSALEANIDLIKDIIETGPEGRNRDVISLNPINDPEVEKAFNLIINNRDYIKAEVIAYTNKNWSVLSQGTDTFYAVKDVAPLQLGTLPETFPDLSQEDAGLVAERTALLNAKEEIREETIAFLAKNYFDNFVFDKVKCYRDVGLILEAVVDDMALGTNYKSIVAGISYLRYYTSEVKENQLEITLASINAARDFTLERVLVEEARDIITANFKIVTDILEFGEGAAPALSLPPLTNSDIGNIDAAAVLQANKEFVKEEVIAWINANLDPFTYDEAKCARDVGLIVDGLTFDLGTGSDYWAVVNGRSYLRANASAVLEEPQKTATLDAMEYLINSVEEIVTVDSNLQTVYDIVKSGTIPSISFPAADSIDPNRVAAKDQLQANKEFIQEEIIAWINLNYTTLIYDEAKCARDVGLIVDAIGYDVMFGSNFRSIVSGMAYYRANAGDVVGAQKIATLAALNQLKTLILGAIGADATALSRASANMDIIIDIFDNGLGVVPAFVIPNPTNITLGNTNAKQQLIANKDFLVAEIVAYINETFVGFTYTPAIQAKCERDLDIIIQSAAYDTALGTNYNTVTAGLAYQRANTSVVQEAQQFQTVAGIRYAQDLLDNGIANTNTRTRFDTAFDEVVNVLKGADPTALVFPVPTGADTSLVAANATLQTNRESIQDDIVSWINTNFVGFEYTIDVQNKCERDLGFIIDAAKFDSALATNYNAVTAGLGYQRANADVVQGSQLIQTVESIKFAKELSVDAVANPLKASVASAFDEVVDIIENNTPDTLVFGESGISATRIAAKDQLQSNRTDIQQQVIDFIETNYPSLNYDQSACSRDVGYIVDALCYDLMYGGNSAAVRNADAYFVGAASQLGAGEITATLAAYEQLKSYVNAVIDNSLHSTVSDLIDIVRAHISNGGTTNLSALLVNPIINEANYSTLNTNKAAIISSTSQFILDNFDNFTYNSTACRRDIGYIIDALSHDVLYGGNWASVRNADAYFVGTQSQLGTGESYVTALAYGELQRQISSLVPGQAVRLTELIDIIKEVIEAGDLLGLPAIEYPTISWVPVGLRSEMQAVLEVKDDIITSTSQYILDTFSGFTYDSAKCARDVGYIVDALTYDITYQGNLETLVAARSYFVGTEEQYGAGEKTATLEAYRYLGEVVNSVAQGIVVTPTTGNAVTQNTAGGPGNSTAGTFLVARVNEISSTIENNGVLPAVIEPDTTWVAAGLVAAKNNLESAKASIQAGVIGFINTNYASFTYNQTKCREDVGYIVDALSHDVLYEGNLATIGAAEAYFVGNQSQLGVGENAATVAAYERLAAIAGSIVQGIAIVRTTGNNLNQVDSGPNATVAEADEITDLIEIINNVIDSLTLTGLPAKVFPTAVNTDADTVASIQALQAARSTLQSSTIDFVNTQNRLVYDEALCSRDVGLIVDAVTYDLVFGTRFRSIKAGQSYLRSYAKEVTQNPQRKAILNALEVIEQQIISVGNANSAARIEIADRISTIRDIIVTLDGDRPYTLPAPSFRAEEAYTVDILEQNRVFLVAEVEAYIKTNYPKLKYDVDACRRDVNYIIDAIAYDVIYGGNSQTINAGQAYYSGNELYLGQGEKVPTLMSYAYLKTLVRNVCLSTVVTPLQNAVTQTTGTFSYSDIANVAAELVEDIRTIINAVDPVPEIIRPNFTWANSQYVAVKDRVDRNITAIRQAVIDDINSKTYFVYKEASCARDVGYIINAICYDLVYGGNTQSLYAAKTYYDGAGKNVVASELLETVAAYGHMKEVLQLIIRNRTVNRSPGNTEIQNTLLSPGSQLSVVTTGDLVDILVEIVKNGINRVPNVVTPDYTAVDVTLGNVRNSVYADKAIIQQRTLDYVESRLLTFNKDTCGRDVGLIIDAVGYDMVFDSNFQSVTAGNSYLRASASVVFQFQLGPTIASIDFIRDKCLEVVAINPTAVSRLTEKFGLIKQILINRLPQTTGITFPAPVNVTQGQLNAVAQIQANRDFIIEEVFEYIDQNYVYLYDQEKCARDVGLILNAVMDDIVLNTNYRTVTAALSYLRSYAGTVTSKQQTKTILGINKARDLAIASITDTATQQQITDLFKVVTDVIEAVDAGVVPALSFGAPINVDAGVFAAGNALQAAKATLATQVINWINDTYTGFIYTPEIQAKCERDLDYIVDAARIDSVLGTNYNAVTAGLAYQRANAAAVEADQLPQTLASLEFAKNQTQAVALNPGVRTNIASAFDQVISGLQQEASPALVFPNPTGVNTNLVAAKNQLLANRDFIRAEIVSWINENFVGFTYTPAIQAKCERDLGIIIDAANFDAALGTNYNSITAGNAYLRENAAIVQESQQIQTFDAILYAKTLAEDVVVDGTFDPRLTSAFNEVVDIIRNGTPDAILFTAPTGSSDNLYAKDQLAANRGFMQAEVLAYIEANYPALNYDEDKCSRDVGYIVDALCYDVLYGGNTATIKNAEAYFVGAVSQLGAGEATATADAYNRLSTVAGEIVRGITVTPTVGNTETQIILADVAGVSEEIIVNNLVQVIRQVIVDGDLSSLPAVITPDLTWTTAGIQADFASLDAAKSTIISDTSQYITDTFNSFNYDSTSCSRDVGYIVDGLVHDILYGGNYASVRVADSYFVGTQSQLGAREAVPTVYAYERLQTVVGQVVRGQDVDLSTGTSLIAVQTVLPETASALEAARLNDLVEITKTVIREGSLDNLAAIQYPDVTWTPSAIETDFINIGAAKENIVSETSAYITRTFSNFVYDQAKCRRDVGFIVEAVAYDVLFNSNFRSITAGLSYYRANASDVIGAQKVETLKALERLKVLISVNIDASEIAKTRAEALMDIIIDIFDTGIAPSVVITDPTTITPATLAARTQLTTAKSDIQNEVLDYIETVFVNFDYSGAVQTTCERDLGIIIDAASYDAAIGTNYNAVTAGNAYRRNNTTVVFETQLPQTIEGIKYAQVLSTNVTSNDPPINAAFAEVLRSLEGSAASTLVLPDASATVDQIAAKNQLIANKTAIATALTAWINEEFVGFTYDAGVQAKCERDLGYIIDAAQYDAVFGTNYNAVTAGLAYQRENAALVEQDQLIQTTEAIRYARDLTLAEMADATGISRATAAFNKVIDLLNSEPVSTLLVFVDPVGADPLRVAAKNSLIANKAAIQASVASFLATNYSVVWTILDVEGQAKCTRDVGYIVDALCYDVLYGGNSAAIRNADAYWVGAANQLGSNSSEVTATLAAYEELKTIVASYVDAGLVTVTNGLIEIIREHINNGGTTDFSSIEVLPIITWASAGLQADFNSVEAEQTNIITATSQFILDNFDNFTYNQAACERDVGYIIDALCYDIMYGGNSAAIRNAQAYFDGAVSQLGTGEQYVTVLSYTKLIDDINAIIGTPAEQVRVETLVGIIRDAVAVGDLSGLPAVVNPAVVNADFNALQAARTSIINNTSTWLATTFNNFTYDSVTCSRDVGLIVDALAYDLTYGGNLETLVAARSYFVGTSAQYGTREQIPTIYAYLALAEYLNGLIADSTSAAFLEARVNDLVSTIVNNGTLPAEILPSTAWVDSEIVSATTEVLLDKAAIQDGVIDYINENYSGFQYDQTKCARDVIYIIDALTYDVLYGGNSQTYSAALTYWTAVGSIIQNQEPQTAAAYDYLKTLVFDALDGVHLPSANRAVELLDIVVDFVVDGQTATVSTPPVYTRGTNFNAQNGFRLQVLAREQTIKDAVIAFLGTGRFNVERCRFDTNLILNAIIYDMMYGGNSQTRLHARAYFDGGKLVNKEDERQATSAAYNYLDLVLRKVVQANTVRRLQTRVDQNVKLAAATQAEVVRVIELGDVLTDIIDNGYTCLLTLDAKFNIQVPINTTMSFHQLSIISASGHTFEWVGAGTDINAALPYQGGVPISENQTIAELGGVIYYTSTDQNGDFKIGDDLTIERDSGNIVGRSFSKSLLAVITPYILALEGG